MDIPVSIWIGLGLVWVVGMIVFILIKGHNIPKRLRRQRSVSLEEINVRDRKKSSGAWRNPFDVDLDRQMDLGTRPYKSRIK